MKPCTKFIERHWMVVFLKYSLRRLTAKLNGTSSNKPLRTKGFSHTWCSWIKTFIHEGFIGIKVNDQVSPYFQTKKGLRQGDPLSPILFLDHDIAQVMNMKLLLCILEQLSGIKINFHKSEIFCFVQAKLCEARYSQLFGCKIGTYPFQ